MDASSWFTDQVTVESPNGMATDGSRDEQWGNRRTVACRITAGMRQVEGPGGEVLFARHTIRCATAIDIKDRLWLPGATVGDSGQARRPIVVTSAHEKRGNYTLYRVLL